MMCLSVPSNDTHSGIIKCPPPKGQKNNFHHFCVIFSTTLLHSTMQEDIANLNQTKAVTRNLSEWLFVIEMAMSKLRGIGQPLDWELPR